MSKRKQNSKKQTLEGPMEYSMEEIQLDGNTKIKQVFVIKDIETGKTRIIAIEKPKSSKLNLVLGCSILFFIFSFFYFLNSYSTLPTAYIILGVVLESLYYGVLLIRHAIKGNISTMSRRIFTAVSIIGVFVSVTFFLFNENIVFILFSIPVFIFLSYAVYNHSVLEKIKASFLSL
ncbi:hypothetical protein LCGC14_2614080, partial [marine sediment metagenome]